MTPKSVRVWSMCLGVGSFYAVSVHEYMKFATKSVENSVYDTLEKGNCCDKRTQSRQKLFSRKEYEDEVKECFFPSVPELRETNKGFGIIVGPTGSGKTTLVTGLCNKFPGGVLYYHVTNPMVFSKGLATAVGMKTSPSNVFDLVLGYFSNKYFMYYRLADDQSVSITTIFGELAKAAQKYRSKHGKMATLFLDGADILAKKDTALFSQIVLEAKFLANAQILTVVLVSSEGSVIPLIENMSEKSRCSKIIEVGDISDEQAIDFLQGYNLPKEFAERVVRFTGGRLIYLINCIRRHSYYSAKFEEDHNMYTKMMDDIFGLDLEHQKHIIQRLQPLSKVILDQLSQQGNVKRSDFLDDHKDNIETASLVIEKLIEHNVMRYTVDGFIDWHGRPQKCIFGTEVLN